MGKDKSKSKSNESCNKEEHYTATEEERELSKEANNEKIKEMKYLWTAGLSHYFSRYEI